MSDAVLIGLLPWSFLLMLACGVAKQDEEQELLAARRITAETLTLIWSALAEQLLQAQTSLYPAKAPSFLTSDVGCCMTRLCHPKSVKY